MPVEQHTVFPPPFPKDHAMLPAKHFLSPAILALLATAAVLYAGPLNPPAGTITSTAKTLTEVEPRIAISATNTPGDPDSVFRISQPGSYYLTGNVNGVASKRGIEIASGGVTLDLNGFALLGIAGSLDGVGIVGTGIYDVHIKNGTVKGWGNRGLNLFDIVTRMTMVSNVQVSQCTSHGIYTADGAVLTNCTANLNGGAGFVVGSGSTVSNCTAYDNTSHGFWPQFGCTIQDCSSYSNTGIGILSPGGCTITHCMVRGNASNGIQVGTDCVVSDNNCSLNGGTTANNILATGDGNRIEANHCNGGARGIRVDGTRNAILRNTCKSNTIDWIFAANNIYGPIIDRRTPASSFVNGFAATGTMGSSDPNANYSY